MTLRFRVTEIKSCPVGWVPSVFRPLLEDAGHGPNPVVCAIGEAPNGVTVTAYLTSLLPHFYVEAPPQLADGHLPELRARLGAMGGLPIRELRLEPAVAVRDLRDYDPTERPLLRITMQRASDIAQMRLLWIEKHHEIGFRWQSMQFVPRVWQADEEGDRGVGADVRSVTGAWVSLRDGCYGAMQPEGRDGPDLENLVVCAEHADLVIEEPEPLAAPRPKPYDAHDRAAECLFDSVSHANDAAGVVCLLEQLLRVQMARDGTHVTDRLFSPVPRPPPPREPDDQRWGKPAAAPAKKAKPTGVALVVKAKPWATRSAADRKGKAPRGQPMLSFGGGPKRAADDGDAPDE
jgi:hypothetical protein